MPIPNANSVKSKIIYLFQEKEELQAKEIHQVLNRDAFACSLQSVYKELKSLAGEGVVRKSGKFYALDSTWVVQLNDFSQTLLDSHFEKESFMSLPGVGQKQQWAFRNLFDLNDFWGYTLLYLLKKIPGHDVLLWYPNVWFYVLDTQKEDRFWKTLDMQGKGIYAIIGNDCFLNQWAQKMLNKNGITTSLAEGPFHNKQSHYYNVVGDYIVTVRLASIISHDIDNIFQQTKSFEDIDLSSLIKAFTNIKNCTITVENNPVKARRMTKKFSQYFGKNFLSG